MRTHRATASTGATGRARPSAYSSTLSWHFPAHRTGHSALLPLAQALGRRRVCRVVDRHALRLRIYVICSECAGLIDPGDGNKAQRVAEVADVVRHKAEEQACWLQVLGMEKV